MATNQNELFAHNFYAWWKTTQQKILGNSCQNTCNKTEIKANFHFSNYKWKLQVAIVTKVYVQQQEKTIIL